MWWGKSWAFDIELRLKRFERPAIKKWGRLGQSTPDSRATVAQKGKTRKFKGHCDCSAVSTGGRERRGEREAGAGSCRVSRLGRPASGHNGPVGIRSAFQLLFSVLSVICNERM